jgi:hypothetical protein
VVDRRADVDARGQAHPHQRASDLDDRSALLVTILLVAFLAFTGVARWSRGLPQAGWRPRREQPARAGRGDALVAGLLGYRAASLRVSTVRDALWSR